MLVLHGITTEHLHSFQQDKKLMLLPLNGGWKPADRSYYSKKLKEYMDTEDSVKEVSWPFSYLAVKMIQIFISIRGSLR